MNENIENEEPKPENINETQITTRSMPINQDNEEKNEEDTTLIQQSPIDQISQTISDNLLGENNKEKEEKANASPKESEEKQILESNNDISNNPENNTNIPEKEEEKANTSPNGSEEKQILENNNDISNNPENTTNIPEKEEEKAKIPPKESEEEQILENKNVIKSNPENSINIPEEKEEEGPNTSPKESEEKQILENNNDISNNTENPTNIPEKEEGKANTSPQKSEEKPILENNNDISNNPENTTNAPEKEEETNITPKESDEKQILENNNDKEINPEESINISKEIEDIVQNIADSINSNTDKSEDNNTINPTTNNIEEEEKEEPQNKPSESLSTESNSGILETLTHDIIDNIALNSDKSTSPTPEPIEKETIETSTEPTDDLTRPRTAIRREYEKSDAGVQFESTEGEIFATSINSPRIETDDNDVESSKTDENESAPNFPPIAISLFSDEELHSALKKQIETKVLPPLEMREELINFARKQSLYKLMSEDYDEAAQIDEAIEQNLTSLHQETVNNDISNQNYALQQQLLDATSQKIILEENHKQRIDDFKKMETRRIEEVRILHESQRRDFEANWSREETLKPFNKPSPKLFQIRRQQKAMAISHDFKNARQLKKMGDALQKEESQVATRKAVEAMRAKYIALIQRQEREMKCMVEYGERRLGQLQVERDNELKASETHINALQNRINNPKTAKRPRVQIPQSSGGRRSAMQSQIAGVVTSRTRSQFANFKKDGEVKTRLEIKIGDVRRITKPLTPTPRKGDKAQTSPFA